MCVRPHRIGVLRDDGNAEVRNTRMWDVVDNLHKYVHLVGREYYGETTFGGTTYALEISVNHIAGVQVAETLCDLRQLFTGVRMGRSRRHNKIGTYKPDSIRIWIFRDIF